MSKYIDILDCTFCDGIGSIFNYNITTKELLEAAYLAKEAGIIHFEISNKYKFNKQLSALNENPFYTILEFRENLGSDVNLQISQNSIFGFFNDATSEEFIELTLELLKKYEINTIRNYDPLNDIRNLDYSSFATKDKGFLNDIAITLFSLPFKSEYEIVEFYKDKLLELLDSAIEFDTITFLDKSGTVTPSIIYELVKMAKELLGEYIEIRYHAHESGGFSVSSYLAALEAGADGIDLATMPVSGGVSLPNILTLVYALKDLNYELGVDIKKIIKYQEFLKEKLKKYPISYKLLEVDLINAFIPNEYKNLDSRLKYKISGEIKKLIKYSGYATPMDEIALAYFNQAHYNLLYSNYMKIERNYARLVLGYFGRTPIVVDPEIEELLSKSLSLAPTLKNPMEEAEKKSVNTIKHWKKWLKENNIMANNENIFFAKFCYENNINFLDIINQKVI